MTIGGLHLGALVALSVKNPSAAARHIIDQNLSRDVLWSLLVLGCVINAILIWASNGLTPPLPDDSPITLPDFLKSPIIIFVFSAGWIVIVIHLLHWIGNAMGGDGSLDDMISVFVWMQALSMIARTGSVVLLILSQPLAALYGLVIMVLSLWITVSFINEGANLGSILKTIGLLVIVFMGVVFGLSLILTITGIAPMMLNQNV